LLRSVGLAGVERTRGRAAVRHPWFDQLTAFFGPDRLALLRSDESRTRMLTAAILHALLQGESAIADLLREPAPAPTHVLMVCAVVPISRAWTT
jgi:hypothetical protein